MQKFGIEIRKAGTLTGLYSDIDKVLGGLKPGEVSAEMQSAAVAHSLQKMINVANYFSVCTIEECAKLCQIHISAERYQLYRTQHCINWSEMVPEFRQQLVAMVLDDFRTVLNPHL